VPTTLVVDRSLIYPQHIWELFETRNLLVAEVSRRLGSHLSMIITYSDVARVSPLEAAMADGPDPVYGSNLQHALLIARETARNTGNGEILLLTYSLPSAHHIDGTQPFFMDPPVEESLDAASREAISTTADGLRLKLLTINSRSTDSRSAALASYFVPLADATGAVLRSVAVGQDVERVVNQVV
jgi:uncharacterized protein with von Willebrand factor type A (vWA) domain